MNWQHVNLGEVADVDWGNTSITKASYVDNGFPAFSATGQDGYLAKAEHSVDGIVLSAIGARCGKCFLASGEWTAIKNTITIIPNPAKINLSYLYALLNDEKSWQTKGAAQPFITLGIARNRKIPLPPLAQQQRIAAILDKAAEIKAKREQAIAKLDELAQSTFNSLMNEAKDKSAITLEECVLDMHQGINTVTEEVQYFDEGYPIIQSKHITSGYLDLTDVRYVSSSDFAKYKAKYKPAANNILLCNIGTIGKSILVQNDVDFLVAWNLFLIKADEGKIVPIFLKHYFDWLFDSGHFNKFLTGGTVKFISKKTLSSTQIELPSLSLQKDFAAIALAIQHSKEMHQTSLNNICNLISSLQHQAFTTGFNA